MDERLGSLLLLNGAQCLDARTIMDLQENGLSPEAFLEGGEKLWKERKLSPGGIRFLSEGISRKWHLQEYERCLSREISLLSFEDPDYPGGLWDLPDPPVVLYCRGLFPPPCGLVGVVGTRRCSSYAWDVAGSLGRALARISLGVVSGGALGIDGAAHGGCLEEGGYSAAVFGTGVDQIFPMEHEDLFENLLRGGGALLSEYPLGTAGKAWRFPRRNRIIAGLAEKIVVVEAPQKSGAIITARLGGEIGREIWAVPGRINEKVCAGSNALLAEGGYPLVSVPDFIDLLGSPGEQKLLFSEDVCEKTPVSPPGEKILAFLRLEGDRTVDNIAQEVTMSAASVTGELALLEALGYIRQTGPGRWGAAL
ncbi:MAG TPA: DNA-processing protein DprA [Synergistaceae bacterium]|nr:DNA-processing protein DprA [Synergistaceae bacterium]